MHVLLQAAFLSTLLITMFSGNPSGMTVQMCSYPSGCLQPRKTGNWCRETERYSYDSAAKMCRQYDLGGCVETCNGFITLEECKKKCSSL
ncbi:hypothetical protein MTO96_044453 [Rhipicephalus appendiculatus]